MKIYFTASSRGTEKFNKFYKRIYDLISSQGHKHTSNYAEESDPSKIYVSDHESHIELYKKATNELKKADIVILEVSKHSLTMGYLLELGLNLSKPVIAMHLNGNKPAFASGITDDKLQVIEYNESNLEDLLIDALDYASSQQDTASTSLFRQNTSTFSTGLLKTERFPALFFSADSLKKRWPMMINILHSKAKSRAGSMIFFSL